MPADIIEEMLKLYPGACLVADRDHNYPVHCCFHECKESLEKKAMMVIDAGPKALAEKSRKLKQCLLFHAVQSRRYSDQLVAKLANAYPKGCEVKDAEGNIPLHLELERGDGAKMEVVKILVEASPSSVKIKDKDKNTPLHSAVESIHDPAKSLLAVQLLMAADADNFAVQQVDSDGNLVLHSACEHKQPNPEVIKLVMEAYPLGLQKKDKDGNLPLHSALEVGDVMPADIIKEMLELYPGACLVADRDLNLPIHSAIEACSGPGREEKLLLLLSTSSKSADQSCKKLEKSADLLFYFCMRNGTDSASQKELAIVQKLASTAVPTSSRLLVPWPDWKPELPLHTLLRERSFYAQCILEAASPEVLQKITSTFSKTSTAVAKAYSLAPGVKYCALDWALILGNAEDVRRLIKINPAVLRDTDPANEGLKECYTPLERAIRRCDATDDLVRLVLDVRSPRSPFAALTLRCTLTSLRSLHRLPPMSQRRAMPSLSCAL